MKMKDIGMVLKVLWILCALGIAIQAIWNFRSPAHVEEYEEELGT